MPAQENLPEVPVTVGLAVPAESNRQELETALAALAKIARIAEKMYFWAVAHRYQVPPKGWEELRVALCLPPPEEPSRIVRSTTLPANPKRTR